MAINPVRNIAPFINVTFTVTSAWWEERWVTIHRGLDIATGANDTVYSMLTGKVLELGGSPSTSTGYYIIIYDDRQTVDGNPNPTYGYATRYLHLQYRPLYVVGQSVQVGEAIGKEGATGTGVTGIHLHVEMQDISRFNWQWHASYTKSDYLDPTIFMGIDNIEGTQWRYDGTPVPPTPPTPTGSSKSQFKWVLYANKFGRYR